jgi:hypothetical protein
MNNTQAEQVDTRTPAQRAAQAAGNSMLREGKVVQVLTNTGWQTIHVAETVEEAREYCKGTQVYDVDPETSKQDSAG